MCISVYQPVHIVGLSMFWDLRFRVIGKESGFDCTADIHLCL